MYIMPSGLCYSESFVQCQVEHIFRILSKVAVTGVATIVSEANRHHISQRAKCSKVLSAMF